jgi:hypothetical protein
MGRDERRERRCDFFEEERVAENSLHGERWWESANAENVEHDGEQGE